MRHVRALLLGLSLLALVVSCAGYVFLSELRATPATTNTPVEFIVAPGETTNDIANRLAEAGLIRQPALFRALVRWQGLDQQIQAGRYVLSPTMTMSEILIVLQSGKVVNDIQITIPEGLRLEEIAAIIAAAGLVNENDFLTVARDGDRFRADYFLLNSLPEGATLEGYLFPDTYRFAPSSDAETIVRKLLDRFVEQYSTIERSVRVPGVTVHQIVTMASIVQREAALLSEMPRISAVFWNRLKPQYAPIFGGGLLGADATVQYAIGYDPGEGTWWKRNLTVDDLAIQSPYNTRINPGLPPGPIAAPGLAALTAAAQPDESSPYLFFVASCEFDGSHKFATTIEEFRVYEAEWLACQQNRP
ncbi:MAG: aminodeoxychorismate lyase [Chloroflexus sp.]|uniref:endolytic transglycosylase MltG n=1 Tax=Chloroflexus sp. TaxID=1904827 RepID=UPI0021DEA613|nr:endolytic transglycosylase MltG [Chloroflexus sp.]GIV91081.1 MAG: aminodeoxychorismate lyase [Chloroflexus sp.]